MRAEALALRSEVTSLLTKRDIFYCGQLRAREIVKNIKCCKSSINLPLLAFFQNLVLNFGPLKELYRCLPTAVDFFLR